MQNLKIRVNSADESKEAQELFFELGASLGNGDKHAVLVQGIIGLAVIDGLINFVFNEIVFFNIKKCKETNILELRAMANQDQDEPFLTPECTLNDQYAEIEQVRQAIKDNVNHPSHYTQGKVECIDAMEAMMTPEQFIGYLRGNLFKYQWRYEKKNGIEDLKKAQWYLEKLTVKIAEKNAPF